MPVTERYADATAELQVTSESLTVALAHRSVRKFTDAPVDDDTLHAVIAAAQSAPTSSNLQAWSVVAVRDPQRKARLSALSGDQQHIVDAPLFLVWIADLDRAHRLAARAGVPLDGANHLESTLIGVIDASLAAQNAVVAAESVGLGTVYIGAIRNHPREVAAELRLPPHTVAVFGMAIGTPDPTEDAGIKPRLPQSAVLHHEVYDTERADADIPRYDAAVEEYYGRFGLTGNWSDRVLARLGDTAALHGREKLRDDLEHFGLSTR
ncbi:NADPH-dependent oxidoreductase [Gordonia sp. NB41Y]|uniref:NADPH-dependent oxidoreductase n=1 Tax=Gordonia sp. NB41Y TaxID=875808 RepID=UPI00034A7581|nr:NADPH-dependent oxidoreductase [Gordonia sp. NB41Y]EMP12326.2 nitroreductase [Gordonia sp. NB41Y]WLP89068.1 NADPH-dependent oxidoreductase [Gordonia sp. NB41Y]